MRTLYFDCFSGAAGDMLLGALLDAGLDFAALEAELAKLGLEGCSLSVRSVVKGGVSARQFSVSVREAAPRHHGGEGGEKPHGRSLARIQAMLEGAPIPEVPKRRAAAAFRRLGVVEADIHGTQLEAVHFHEVGAVDSIIDVAGYFLGLHLLGVERVAASPLPVGRGWAECAHGRMPVPAPATAKLLEGVPVSDNGLEGEVLTPTGALLLGESAEFFGPMPDMTIERVGYGAGEKDFADAPNLVRAFLGESEPSGDGGDGVGAGKPPATVAVLEANVDDMSPELIPHVIEGAMRAGALDAFSIPVTGKKGRPAQLLTILAPLPKREALTRFLFRETSTLGVRHRRARRSVAAREWVEVELPWGRARVKKAAYQGELVNLAPEYEDCRRLAEAGGVPLKRVMEAAAARARETLEGGP